MQHATHESRITRPKLPRFRYPAQPTTTIVENLSPILAQGFDLSPQSVAWYARRKAPEGFAMAQGVKTDAGLIKQIVAMREAGRRIVDIARELGLHRQTVRNYLKAAEAKP